MSTPRDAILAGIRGALAGAHAAPAEPASYRRTLDLGRSDLTALFTERIADYDVTVRETTEAGLTEAIAERCAAHDVRRLAVPTDLPSAWLPPGIELVPDEALDN